MENLTKCSERKKNKGEKAQLFFLFLLSVRIKKAFGANRGFGYPGAVPSHSEQSSQDSWQTQALGSRAAQKLWLHRLETVEKPLVLPGEPLTPNSNEFETQLNAVVAQDLLFCSCNTQSAQPNPKAGVGLQLKRSCPSALCCVPVLVKAHLSALTFVMCSSAMSQGTQLWQTLQDPITRSRQQPLVGCDHDVIMGQDPQLLTHCHSTNTQSEQIPLSAERRFVQAYLSLVPSSRFHSTIFQLNISGAELYLFQSCTGRGKLVWVDREGIR